MHSKEDNPERVVRPQRFVGDLKMKCEVCKNTVQETFLKKIIGSYVKDEKGKLHTICFECQKKFTDKKKILEQLK